MKWAEFIAWTSRATEAQLLSALHREIDENARISRIIRLHQAYCAKRAKRERAELLNPED
jgi:hypothetical protein